MGGDPLDRAPCNPVSVKLCQHDAELAGTAMIARIGSHKQRPWPTFYSYTWHTNLAYELTYMACHQPSSFLHDHGSVHFESLLDIKT